MKDYIVSARKYRPMTFDAVVGQSALITTLKNAVKSGKLAHAYLFCGPRGVGKTTCARIFAKAINCLNPTADGEACNECESCQAFNEQRSYNIFELDAASNNSVENIKSLMDQTRIPPQVGKYKVFIIDEVHMLSTSAFNAFLKTLEEPPAHVIFILATTEKHKILPTILSRCQIYDFERMATADIINHLKNVAQQEGITYEDAALNIIAEKADGGMRDALSVFDQAASFCQGNITYDKVLQDLNVLDADNYFKMVDLCLENKVSDVMVLLNSILARGFDGGHLTNGLASHIRNVLMAKDAQTLPLLEVSEQQRQKYQQQAQKCPTKFLYQALKILNRCDVNYRQSSNKRLLVELTLIEVAQATQADDASDGAGRSPKRLKPLFKKLAPAMGGETNQHVASSETGKVSPANARHTPITTAQQPSTSTPAATSKSAAQRPRLTLSDIGMSFNDLRNGGKKPSYQTKPEQKVTAQNTAFSEQELMIQWKVMCNRMPQEKIGLAQRMKNLTPRITNFPNIEVVIDNDILLKQLQDDKENILAEMRTLLKNAQLNINLRLAEAQEVTKIYSKREIFEMLKKENPQFSKLCQSLKLQLG
ncbi:DNA polymerase III, subunit gamma and tau [Prevotella sp. BV3P1]|uniref:DNA polymerase III subunit gamma/tau n=1 Tax=Prevotellaceae TaxID=171552 RepID=UPI0003B8564E|nr:MULTISPECIES: DNA polymerase III subunit gamma/tau [Prevotellaceae]ERT61056.1 DNA polymerase III, subunit gamma and tau [Prevotella sp. BV3P1]KGF42882.1 DNA polymerase III subunits gamma and tau [Hoylesella buccalis DNF00985]